MEVIQEFKHFTQSADFALISGFEDYCRSLHVSPLEMDLKSFTLSEDFRMRCVDLSDIPDKVFDLAYCMCTAVESLSEGLSPCH